MKSSKDKEMSLDRAYQDLKAIVAEFESGELGLEESIPKFEEGLKLASYLKQRLKKVQNRVEEIKEKFTEMDGELVEEARDELGEE